MESQNETRVVFDILPHVFPQSDEDEFARYKEEQARLAKLQQDSNDGDGEEEDEEEFADFQEYTKTVPHSGTSDSLVEGTGKEEYIIIQHCQWVKQYFINQLIITLYSDLPVRPGLNQGDFLDRH